MHQQKLYHNPQITVCYLYTVEHIYCTLYSVQYKMMRILKLKTVIPVVEILYIYIAICLAIFL